MTPVPNASTRVHYHALLGSFVSDDLAYCQLLRAGSFVARFVRDVRAWGQVAPSPFDSGAPDGSRWLVRFWASFTSEHLAVPTDLGGIRVEEDS